MFTKLLAILGLLSAVALRAQPDNLKASIDSLLRRQASDPEAFAETIRSSEFAAVAKEIRPAKFNSSNDSKGEVLPLVYVHGMGDSCFNPGMRSITKESGIYLRVYSTCVPTGDSWLSDTLNGFFMDMNTNVDVFAQKVKADKNLANGFNCM